MATWMGHYLLRVERYFKWEMSSENSGFQVRKKEKYGNLETWQSSKWIYSSSLLKDSQIKVKPKGKIKSKVWS